MSADQLYEKRELLLRIARGDDQAFTLFFRHYQDRVLNIAFYFTQSLPGAQDIVQDVFLKIWKHRERLATIEYPDSYVATMARHYSINTLKKMARKSAVEEGYTDHIPALPVESEHSLEYKDLQRYIEEALSSLSEQQRRVFELSKLQGMSREEIAGALSLSPNTVKMHLVRATKYVRAFLAVKLDHLLFLLFFTCF